MGPASTWLTTILGLVVVLALLAEGHPPGITADLIDCK